MKKIFLLSILILLGINLMAQNGFTTWPNSIAITAPEFRTTLKIDHTGNKWYSTTKGLYKFDGTSWLVYNISNSAIPGNTVNGLTIDPANNVWVATQNGIAKFDGISWTTYNVSNSGLVNDTVNCIHAESSNIWAGTKQGLSKFDGASWTLYNTANSGIINNNINAVNVNSGGDVWVAAVGGLSVKTASSWTHHYEIYNPITIYFENAGTTWVGNTNGLYKYDNAGFSSYASMIMGMAAPATGPVQSITKGPQGGVLVAGVMSSNGGFIEILGSAVYFYAFPPSSSYNSYVSDFDPATNMAWFTSKTGTSTNNRIFSFDYSLFTGTFTAHLETGLNILDVNQVRAVILDRGDMHWDLTSAGYEVPKNLGVKAIFASSLWIGGLDNGGTLHQAAMTYRQTGNDYWPGPLDTITGTTDSTASAAFDKIWKLDRWKIDEFRTNFANGNVTSGAYIPDPDLINWPAVGSGNYGKDMAPFVDVNGDGLYNPMVDGDYPKIKGDQMCYWIFNDNLHAHTETGGAAFKVEVHASAYAYNCDSISDSLKALNYTTFYDYEIYNRSASNYHNMYVGLWEDSDLGAYNDDYVGCNPANNYSFTYNGDSIDEGTGGILGYGANPPMLSNVILNGPLAVPGDGIDNNNNGTIDEAGEKNLMTNVLNYNNNTNPVNGNPATAANFYSYMQNKWKDGSDVTYGGDGVGAGTPVRYMYDGVPTAPGWSEATLNNPFVDRRIVMSCGPFNLDAAQHVNFNYAIVYTRDNQPAYNIVSLYNRNKADVEQIRQWYTLDNFPSCDPVTTGIATHTTPVDNSMLLYPNPANEQLYIRYETTEKNTLVEIYDVTGQLVKQRKMNFSSTQQIDISNLSAGLYVLKITDGKKVNAQRFVKQ
ncbi:MAG: hypothetical protein JWP12_3089 [Bacteroidetes bacterium]|nr:hypothetical protein [Bacteroidota bacterium]